MGNRLTRPTQREMEMTDPEVVGFEQALLEEPSTSISESEESTAIHEHNPRGGQNQSQQTSSPDPANNNAQHVTQPLTINDLAAQVAKLQQNYDQQSVQWEKWNADQAKEHLKVQEQQKEIITLNEEVRLLRDLLKFQEEKIKLLETNNAISLRAVNKEIDPLKLAVGVTEKTIENLKTVNSDILNQFTEVILNVTDLVRVHHPDYVARLATIEISAATLRTRLISELRKFSTVNSIAHRVLLERLDHVPEDDVVGTITAIMFAIASVLNSHEGSINSIQYREQFLMSGFASNNPMASSQYGHSPGGYVGAYDSTAQQAYSKGQQYF